MYAFREESDRMSKKRRNIIMSILAVFIILIIVVNGVAVYWDAALTPFFGVVGEESGVENAVVYEKDYATEEELTAAAKAMCEEIEAEGVVLLKNEENALPLKEGAKISLFSQSCVDVIVGGTGSSEAKSKGIKLDDALENAGFSVNPTLWKFYEDSGYQRGAGANLNGEVSWALNEVPISEYTDDVRQSYQEYADAAIVVLSRAGGEGTDLPMNMSYYDGLPEENYLSISTAEKALLKEAAANFETVIVLVNSCNAMELGAIEEEEYGVDACLWIGGAGIYGLNSVAAILKGDVNPSGKLVDTYVYDSFSAPAAQNFGDFRYVDENGNLTDDYYVNYVEGIYVGYRYYETRYADTIMGRKNVGTYSYEDTVQYPFGYGLSYTEFELGELQLEHKEEACTAKITVTNSGKTAGKEVVELYAQAPYKDGGMEKPAIQLIGFAKTEVLEPGESEEVSVDFMLSDLSSYDYEDSGVYVLDKGTYYIAAAGDAHTALNYILKKQGYEVNVDRAAAGKETVCEIEVEKKTEYDTAASGNEIKQLFTEIGRKDTEYLSRSNWKAMDQNGLVYATSTVETESDTAGGKTAVLNTMVLDDETKAALTASGMDGAKAPEMSYEEVTTGDDNGIELIDMVGAEYDDPRWEKLLDEMTLDEMNTLFCKAGYFTAKVGESGRINKPKTKDIDGPAGLSSYVGSLSGMAYPIQNILSSSWNTGLAERFGVMVGNESLYLGVNGWYAPGMNIHRTAFGGRNSEYYSEDGYLSGMFGAAQVKGAQSKGLYVYIKHFALNDQETMRDVVATYCNEQALREIYFKPFQLSVEKGGALGVMTAQSRIGAYDADGYYNLTTALLRGEWDFKGVVITDWTYPDSDKALAAGVDLILNTAAQKLSDPKSARTQALLRQAAHRTMYVVANSNAMNGMEKGVEISEGFPVYKIILIALDIAAALIVILAAAVVQRKYKKTNGRAK